MTELRDQITSYSKSTSKEAQSIAKPALSASLHSLLQHISIHDIPEATRRGVDEELATKHATVLKWGLLRGLQRTDLARSYLGLPRTLEQTRIFLASVSLGKANDILQTELGKNMDACQNADELKHAVEVVTFLIGHGRFKKDLGGVDLSKDAKRACRTAINRAGRLEKVLMKQKMEREKALAKTPEQKISKAKDKVWMERDVRVEDKEREMARKKTFSLGQYL